MNTTYLSCVLFFGTCCWTPTDNIGGGGGGVIDCILCLQCNRCLKIVIDYEHYLYIMRSFFFGTCCWTLTDNMGGGGGSAVYNQCRAIKTRACLFFASRGPAIRWA